MAYPLGSFQGGPDPNDPRNSLVQAILAQQGFSPFGAFGTSGAQPGDPSSVDIGALFGGSTPSYESGAPGAGMGIGRGGGESGGRSPGAGAALGGLVSANASMTTNDDTAAVGGPFGGRGGEGREGFGEGVSDPALGSPSFSEPGAVTVSGFGRSGDDTSAQSQANQAADRAALAEAAAGRSQTSTVADPDALTEGMGGKGDKGYTPGTYTPDFNTAFNAFAPGAPIGAPVAGPWEPGVVPLSDIVVAPPPSGWQTQTFVQPTPTARSTPSFARSTPATPTPDVADPGATTGFGFGGGFSESTPGGYAGGPGMTTGFGAGYSGSSDFGNTQGAQGFTTGQGGGFSSGAVSGFSTGGFEGGVPGGFEGGPGALSGNSNANEGMGGGVGGGGGGEGGGGGFGGGGGGFGGGGSDPGGSSPGGVG